jgi:tetratricopeptide (TPR) repeat protein
MDRTEETERLWAQFRTDPQNENLFNTLKQVCFLGRDWETLVQAQIMRANVQENPLEAGRLFCEAAGVYQSRLSAPDAAIGMFEKALRQDPRNREALRHLGDLCYGQKEFEKAAQYLRLRLNIVRDPQAREEILFRIGDSLLQSSRTAEAEDALRELLKANPRHVQALEILGNLLHKREAWDDLASVYELRVDAVSNPEDRRKLLFRTAKLYEERLQRFQDAVRFYRRVVEDRPVPMIFKEIERLCRRMEDWEGLADVLKRQADNARDPAERTAILFELGKILDEKLGRADDSIQSLREVVQEEAFDPGSLVKLEELYRRQERHEDLAEVLARRESMAEGAEQHELGLALAALYEQKLADPDRALTWYRKVLGGEEAPDPAVEKSVEDLYLRLQRFEDLAAWYAERAGLAQEPGQRADLLLQKGRVELDKLADPARASETLSAAQELDPGRHEITLVLQDALVGAGRLDELAEIERARLEGIRDPAAQLPHLLRLGQILSTIAERKEEAAQAYEKILEIDPAHLEAIEALGELWEEGGKHRERITLYMRTVDLVDDPKEVAVLHVQAAEAHRLLDEPDLALSSFRKAFVADRANPQALAALEEHARSEGNHEEYIDVLSARRETAGTPQEEVEVLLEIGKVLTGDLGRTEDAAAAFSEALRLDMHCRPAYEALDALYTETGDHRSRVDLLRRLGAVALERDETVAIQLRAGRILAGELDDAAGALEAFERALAFDPHNAEALAEAEPLFEREGRWAEQVSTLETLADLSPDPEEKARLLRRAAAVAQERLEGPEKALGLLAAVDRLNPSDLTALREQAHILRRTGDWFELISVLNQEQDRLDRPSPDVEREIGLTYLEKLGDPRSALFSFRRLLEMVPDDVEALERVADITRDLEDWPAHVEIIKTRLGLASSPRERGAILLAAGRVYQEKLGSLHQAREHFERAFVEDPENEDVRLALGEAAAESGDWESVSRVLRFGIDRTEGEKKRGLLEEFAVLLEEKCLDLGGAVEAVREILAMDSGDRKALRRLAGLYRRTGETDRLRKVLGRLADFEEDPGQKAALFRELAEMELVWADDVDGAARWLDKAAAETPKDPDLHRRLSALYAAAGRMDKAMASLGRVVDLAGDDAERVEALLRIGAAEAARGRVEEGALPAYEKALEIDPACLPALRGLRQIADRAGDSARVAELIEEELHHRGRRESECRNLLFSLGRVYEALDRVDDAIGCYRDLLSSDPGFLPALGALEQIYESREDYGSLVETCEKIAGAVAGKETRRDLLVRVARIHQTHLADTKGAVEWFREALRIDDGHLPAIRGLGDSARKTLDWEAVLEAVDLEVELDVPAERKVFLLRTTGFDLAQHGRNPDALRCLDRAADLRDDDPELLLKLADLLEADERWDRLAWVLRTRLGLLSHPEEKTGTALRLARILDSRLGDAEAAREVLAEALSIQKGPEEVALFKDLCERLSDFEGLAKGLVMEADQTADRDRRRGIFLELGALRRDRLEDLPGAVEAFGRALSLHPRDEVASRALSSLYAELGRHRERVDLSRKLLAFAETLEEKNALWTEIGRLCETELGEPEPALAAYAMVEGEDPGTEEAVQGLARLWAAVGRPFEVVRARRREIAVSRSREQKIGALREIAGLWEQRIRDPRKAMEAYEELCRIDESHPLALDAQERILWSLGRWRDLVAVKDSRIRRATREGVKIRHLREAAAILSERLGDTESAAEYLERAHDLNPVDEKVEKELCDALTAAGDWEGLLRLWQDNLDGTPAEDRDERFALLVRIGELLAENAPDPARSAEYYERALRLNPEDLGVIRSLREAYERIGNLEGLAEMMERELSLLEEKESTAVRRELGALFEKRLCAFDEAVRVLRPLLETEPRDTETLAALKRCYRKAGRFEDLISAYEVEFMHTSDRSKSARVLCRIGQVYMDDLHRPEEAVTSYLEALELLPSDPRPLDALRKLYRLTGDEKALAETTLRRASLSEDRDEETALLLEAGRLFEGVGESARAREANEKVLTMRPRNPDAVEALSRLYEKAEDWEALIRTLKVYAEITRDEERAVELYVRLGEVWLDRFEDAAEAEKPLATALELRPRHLRGLRGMARILRERQDWDGLAGNLLAQAAEVEDPAEKAYVQAEAGRVLLDRLSDETSAREQFRAALALDPHALSPLMGLADIALSREDWKEAGEILGRLTGLLGEDDDPAQRVDAHFKLGSVLEKAGSPPEEVAAQYTSALAVDPTHVPSLEAAVAVFSRTEQWHNALDLLEVLVEISSAELRCGTEVGYRIDFARSLLNTGNPARACEVLTDLDWPADEEKKYFQTLLDARKETGDWEGAVALLEEAAERFSDSRTLGAIRAAAGRILTERLESPARAVDQLAAALEADPGRPEVMRLLAEALEKNGEWKRAEVAWKNFLEKAPDEGGAFEGWMHLGRCYFEGEDRAEPAIEAFKKALDLRPDSLEAVDRIKEVRESREDWQGLRRDLEGALEGLGDAPAPVRIGLHFRIGEILLRTSESKKAEQAFRNVLKEDPDHMPSHLNLARLYARNPVDYPKAVEEHRHLLSQGPVRPDSLRRLAGIYQKSGDADRAFLAVSLLRAFADPEGKFRELYEEGAPARLKRSEGLGGVAASLAEEKEFGPLADIFDQIDPYLGRAVAPGLDKFGVSRRSLRGGDMESEGGKVASKIAGFLGTEEFRFVVGTGEEKPLLLIPGDPPSLVATEAFDAAFPAMEKGFLLGRSVGLCAVHRVTPAFVPAEELKDWLAYLARVYIPEVPPRKSDAREDRIWLKAVRGALPRRVRKSVEEPVREYWDNREDLSVSDFCAHAVAGANRLGLVAVADPFPALRALAVCDLGLSGPELGSEGQKALGEDSTVRDLVLFALSEEYAAVRRKLGHALGT